MRVSAEMRRLFRDWQRGVDSGHPLPPTVQEPAPERTPKLGQAPAARDAPPKQKLRLRCDGRRPIEATGWVALELAAEAPASGRHSIALYCLDGGSVCLAADFRPTEGSGLRPVYSAAIAPDADALRAALTKHRPSAAVVFGGDEGPNNTIGADLDAAFEDLVRAAGLRWPESDEQS